MKLLNINDVLSRLEDLRISMEYSNELFPLFSDVFLFIRDIIPLMLEANASLRVSTDKIPGATESLDTISKTTEMATNQVLDKLEEISQQMEKLKKNIANKTDINEQINVLNNLQNDTTEIVYAFQFQDITTQKLEHVNRILKAIHDKFMVMFSSFKKLKENSSIGGEIINAIELELDKKLDLEKSEAEFHKETEDIVRDNGFTQDAIDQLFK